MTPEEPKNLPLQDWENREWLMSQLHYAIEDWSAQGRGTEQIYGVTNFLTGLGGKKILDLLSLARQEGREAYIKGAEDMLTCLDKHGYTDADTYAESPTAMDYFQKEYVSKLLSPQAKQEEGK